MKKLLLLLLLLCPLVVNAEVKVISHFIDSEIEIAGALNVKELIIVEGEGSLLQRTLNYYSFQDKEWDNKTVDLNDGTIYNAFAIHIVNVVAYEFDGEVEFGDFDNGITEYFPEFDIKKPSDNTYSYTDNENGTGSLKIYYPVKNKKTAFYVNYIVTNVVVKHNDVKEVNYTFKNLYKNSKETYLRVIIPYPTKDELYNFWIHGNNSGLAQELFNKKEQKTGILARFSTGESINFRMTLPQDQVGVDIYLNNSGIDALDDIIKIEDARLSQTNKSATIINVMHYALLGFGVIFTLATILFIKNYNKLLYILYLAFGFIIILCNFLFRFNFWYIYIIVLWPIILQLVKKFIVKS